MHRAGEAGTDRQARTVRGHAAALRGPFGSRDSAAWGRPVIRPQGKPVKQRFLPSEFWPPGSLTALPRGLQPTGRPREASDSGECGREGPLVTMRMAGELG